MKKNTGKNLKRRAALFGTAMALFGSLTAQAATCNCPYGYCNSGGPGGGGACTCLESQGPNSSGVCTCTGYWNNGYYGNGSPNNPAYNTGVTGGGPGHEGNNPGGSAVEKWENDALSKGPGSDEANRVLQEEENGFYIFGDPYKGGNWEQQENGSWKLKKDDGQYVSSQWADVGGKMYLIDYDGTMLTGFRKVNGKWYYFNSVGAMQTGWLLKDRKYYFLNMDGSMAFGWVNTGGKWYYFSSPSGTMLTSAYTPDGFFVNAEGVLI